MTNRITPGQIKKNNRQQIYNYIYQERNVSQQAISYALSLSRPTVATNLAELEEDGLICKNGQLESDQIGRKAVAYAIVRDFRIAIGVEIMRHRVKLIALDLYGEKLRRDVLTCEYANFEGYYERLCEQIKTFIASLDVSPDRVLGIGIAMQGLVSPDGRTMVYGKILNCTGLKIDAFEQWLNQPCRFIHDPAAAAISELWVSQELENAVYLSLSRHLGGAIIMNRRIVNGRHGHSATYEHVQVHPRGELCYCGKRGCWDTLCSMKVLIGNDDADAFFEAARREGTPEAQRWHTYRKNLARLIEDMHLLHDEEIILGGHLAPYLTEEDIRVLYSEIHRLCPFEEADDYIRISKMPSHNITVGAALPYIQRFLEDIDAASE